MKQKPFLFSLALTLFGATLSVPTARAQEQATREDDLPESREIHRKYQLAVRDRVEVSAVSGSVDIETTPAGPQAGQLKTVEAVLERYQQTLGGVDAIKKIQSETAHGEVESSSIQGKATFVSYAKPFKSLFKLTRPDGREIISGFDGNVSWTITPAGKSIDKDTPIESVRRDTDLQYALHQPDYFKKLEFAGITQFDGRACYWLHGTTHWGKDNNQFYDVQTGLLAGYRFQSDDASSVPTTLVFSDYKRFGGPLSPTKMTVQSSFDCTN